MKQQTFNLFDEELTPDDIEQGFDLDLDATELNNIDQTLQIVGNDTGEMEDIDFDEQFETVNFNSNMNEDMFNPTLNDQANNSDDSDLIMDMIKNIQPLDENQPSQVVDDLKVDDQTSDLDTHELYMMCNEQTTDVSNNFDVAPSVDFKTLDTVQFSQELGDVTIIDDEDQNVVSINLEPEEFIDSINNVEFGDLKLMVVGVGGCGCNVINRMYDQTLNDVKLVGIDTDARRLETIRCDKKMLIGSDLLHGNGSGFDPALPSSSSKVIESFRQAHQQFIDMLEGYHIVFIVGSLSGGTGQVGLMELGRCAHELGVLSIGFTIAPYRDELDTEHLNHIFSQVTEQIDSTILVDTAAMAASSNASTLKQANDDVDKALINGIKGIYELATKPGLINLDYADICTVFKNKGSALMSIGMGSGENNIIDAVNNAIHSYVFDGDAIETAQYAIIGISAPTKSVSIKSADKAASLVANLGRNNNDLLVIFGWTIDESLDDEVKATVVLTSKDSQVIRDYQTKVADNDMIDYITNVVKQSNVINNAGHKTTSSFSLEENAPFEAKSANKDVIDKQDISNTDEVSVISTQESEVDRPDFF